MAQSPTRKRLHIKLTQSAQRDLSQILSWTQQQFGLQTAQNYLLLMQTSFKDLSIQPERVGVRTEEKISGSLRVYHLRFSKNRLPVASRIKHPRHILVFRVTKTQLQIARVLHESMDLTTQLEMPLFS